MASTRPDYHWWTAVSAEPPTVAIVSHFREGAQTILSSLAQPNPSLFKTLADTSHHGAGLLPCCQERDPAGHVSAMTELGGQTHRGLTLPLVTCGMPTLQLSPNLSGNVDPTQHSLGLRQAPCRNQLSQLTVILHPLGLPTSCFRQYATWLMDHIHAVTSGRLSWLQSAGDTRDRAKEPG